MPIFVRHYHLLNNFLNILVGCFHSSVHLWSVGCGIVMLDFEICAHFLHNFVFQIDAIVSNDLPREPVLTNQLPLYEYDHHTPRDIGVGSRFDPFGEIIYCHENEAMTVRSLGFDGPYDVYPPHGKRLRGGHDVQRMWRSIDIVRERLTFMAFPYMVSMVSQ